MNRQYARARAAIAFALLTLVSILCGPTYAGEPQPGGRYKIIRPVYLMAIYDSLDNKQLSATTARAYVHSTQYYEKSSVAFQCEVPAGTTMTIVSAAPKAWYLPFAAKRYFVRLDPDPSRGLDVILELNRGMEGSLDGLNPEIFGLGT